MQKTDNNRNLEDVLQISDIQHGMVYHYQKNVEESVYHVQFRYEINFKDFNISILRKAFELLVDKHAILRTSFNLTDYESPVQLIHKNIELDIEDFDLVDKSKPIQSEIINTYLIKDRENKFNEKQAPLWRMRIFHLGGDKLCVLWISHHAILDGWSNVALMSELTHTIERLRIDPLYKPNKLKCSYIDVIVEEYSQKNNSKNYSFWKKELYEFEMFDIASILKSDSESKEIGSYGIPINRAIKSQLDLQAVKYKTSPKNICFSAYAYMLYMVSYKNDLTLGYVTNTRPLTEDGDKILGCFLNTIPVRVQFKKGMSWREYVEYIDEKFVTLKAFERFPLFQIKSTIIENSSFNAQTDMFNTLFNYLNFYIVNSIDNEKVSADYADLYGATNTLFDFEIAITNEKLFVIPKYLKSDYNDRIVKKLCSYFLNILKKIIQEPDEIMDKAQVMSSEDRNTILYEFNNTDKDLEKNRTIIDLYKDTSRKSIDRVALIYSDENYGGTCHISYGLLSFLSDKLADYLRKEGVKNNTLVPIVFDRTPDMIISILGVLKAGGAYVPIETRLPDARVIKILRSIHAEKLVTTIEFSQRLNRFVKDIPSLSQVIYIDENSDHSYQTISLGPKFIPGQEYESKMNGSIKQGDLAYIIFTSGSTGNPKGVMVKHLPLMNIVEWMNRIFSIQKSDKLLFVVSYSFDLSVYDILGTLSAGAAVRIVRTEELNEPETLSTILVKEGITIWNSTPATLQQLVPSFENQKLSIAHRFICFLSGDWIPVNLPVELKKYFHNANIVSLGGATEATIWSNYFKIETYDPNWKSIPYGKPIQNAKYYILDNMSQVCPVNVPGELYIGGKCLSSGYVDDPETTAQQFTTNPYITGEVLYRTGDFAKWHEDGNMEFLGRIDKQVKIRGYRIELGEIEAVIKKVKEIKDVYITTFSKNNEDKKIHVYYVASRSLDKEYLNQQVLNYLPAYFKPHDYIRVNKIPLTVNGKIDEKQLPIPQGNRLTALIKPKDRTEQTLTRIWATVLKIKEELISVESDFFELGGHSLNVTQLAALVHRELDRKLSLKEIFELRTLRKIADFIKIQEKREVISIKKAEKKEFYKQSSAQQRFFFLNNLGNYSTAYNMPLIIKLKDDVSLDMVKEVAGKIVERHASLRTCFKMINGIPAQVILPSVDFSIEVAQAAEEDLMNTFQKEIQLFQLDRPPLFKIKLIETNETVKYLFLDIHHIISDDISLEVLSREFKVLFAKESLRVNKLQYIDFSEWQHSKPYQKALLAQKKFWQEEFLETLNYLELPYDLQRPVVQSFDGETLMFTFDQEATGRIRQYALDNNVTIYMFFLSALTVLFHKLSHQKDFCIGTPVSERSHPDLENLAGVFINTLPVKCIINRENDYLEHLQRIKEKVIKIFNNKEYGVEKIIKEAHTRKEGGRNPLFDIMFNYLNDSGNAGDIQPNNSVTVNLENSGSKFDISFIGYDYNTIIQFHVEYCSILFYRDTIIRYIEYFREIVANILKSENQRISDFSIISELEKKKILIDFNSTDKYYQADKTVHTLFKEQIDKQPTKIALSAGNEFLTFDALNRYADNLALWLRENGIESGSIVGLIMDRSPEMIISIFGILKTGAAYLPIHPDFPLNRMNYIIADSNISHVIIQEKYKSLEVKSDKLVFNLQELIKREGYYSTGNNNSSNLAYIIYTSGSTGLPKGTAIEHHSVVNRLSWMQNAYPIGDNDIILQKTSFVFDVSVWELFWWSIQGARLCLLEPGGEKDPGKIIQCINQNKVTVLHFVPTMLNAFLSSIGENFEYKKLKSLKYVFISGEVLNPQDVNRFNKTIAESTKTLLINLYGPTEATVDVSYYTCEKRVYKTRIPIGKPIDNTKLLILDKDLNMMPIGVTGELHIAGVGIARGYINNVELTHSKFVSDPYHKNQTIYKTGDVAKWLPDGTIDFLGRKDDQVKINGFRVELEEIKQNILKHPLLTEAVVLIQNIDNNIRLLSFYVAKVKVKDSELRDFLDQYLPFYMVPSQFQQVDVIPVTTNGKVDRKKLLQQITQESGTEITYNKTKRELLTIWKKELMNDSIKLDSNFFTTGGDSIRAIKLVNSINNFFGVDLGVTHLYENSTINKIYNLLAREDRVANTDNNYHQALEELEGIKQNAILSDPCLKDAEDFYPMTDIERGIVFYYLRYQNIGVYHDQFVFNFQYKKFDVDIFLRALELLTDKHEILRASFSYNNEREPLQVIHPKSHIEFYLEDICTLDRNVQKKKIDEFIRYDVDNSFVLEKYPLWRIQLFKLDKENYVLIFVTHHALLDGWSIAALTTELNQVYQQLMQTNKVEKLTKLKSSYKDAVIEEIKLKNDPSIREFWKNELCEYTRHCFFTKKKSNVTRWMKIYYYNTGNQLLDKLKEFSVKYNISVKNVSFAAYLYAISMFSSEKDMLVGIVTNNRPLKKDGEKILGCFLNTIPFRFSIPRNATYIEFVSQVNEKLISLKPYEGLSLFEISNSIGEKQKDQNPFFDTLFNFMNFHVYENLEHVSDGSEYLKNNFIEVIGNQNTNTLFDFEINATFDNFSVQPKYDDEIIRLEQVQKFCIQFEKIIHNIINVPEKEINYEDILSVDEKRRLVYEFNDTSGEYPQNISLIELFQNSVIKHPDRTAITDGNSFLTYAGVNLLANSLAGILQEGGVKERENIAIIMNRSFEMIISVLAILKLRCVYVPFEPLTPETRIVDTLKSVDVSAIIANQSHDQKINQIVSKLGPHVLLLNFEKDILPVEVKIGRGILKRKKLIDYGSCNPALQYRPDDIAYIIHTSGSTGIPKGVVIKNSTVVNTIDWINETFNVMYNDKLLFIASITFDLSVYDLFGILSSGASIRLIDYTYISNPENLVHILIREGITMWNSAPAALQQIVPYFDSYVEIYNYCTMRLMLLSGDWVPLGISNLVRRLFKNAQVISLGGATEASIWTNSFAIQHIDPEWRSIPYGKPIQNVQYYILDEYLNPCMIGVEGNLYISGDCLSLGYLNEPEHTRNNFIDNPFIPGKKMFHTGDRVKYFEDGNIEFLGRKDNQVKIRGYRIELGDIQKCVSDLDYIDEVVVLSKILNRDKYICAYYVSKKEISKSVFISGLEKSLPDYMIPTFFIKLESFPLTINGKIDYNKLPDPIITKGAGKNEKMSDDELMLLEICSEILNIEPDKLSLDDDFFELGGHSLNVTALINRIRNKFKVSLNLVEVFNSSRLRDIVRLIKEQSDIIQANIIPVEKKEYYPQSLVQKRLYLTCLQNDENNQLYSISNTLFIKKRIDLQKIEDVFQILVNRHEVLRTRFLKINKQYVQIILKTLEFKILHVKLLESLDYTVKSFIQPFNLSEAPLFRIGVIDYDEDYFVLVTNFHHIIVDELSYELIVNEFLSVLNDEKLNDIRIQYKDYVKWHEKYLQMNHKRLKNFWMKQFQRDIPLLNLATDYERPKIKSYQGAYVNFRVPDNSFIQLQRVSEENESTLFMGIISILYILLHKLSNQTDITIGVATAGRNQEELDNVLGMFVNVLPFRCKFDRNITYASFIQEIKDLTLNNLDNQEYQYDSILNDLGISRTLNHNPLFDVAFSMVRTELRDNLLVQIHDNLNQHTEKKSIVDLTFQVITSPDEMFFHIEYSTALFKPGTIDFIFDQILEIIHLSIDKNETIENIIEKIDRRKIESGFMIGKTIEFDL